MDDLGLPLRKPPDSLELMAIISLYNLTRMQQNPINTFGPPFRGDPAKSGLGRLVLTFPLTLGYVPSSMFVRFIFNHQW